MNLCSPFNLKKKKNSKKRMVESSTSPSLLNALYETKSKILLFQDKLDKHLNTFQSEDDFDFFHVRIYFCFAMFCVDFFLLYDFSHK